MKYTYKIKADGKLLYEGSYSSSKLATIYCAMDDFYKWIGDGDNENEGKGSLWNCVHEIFRFLWENGEYEYADVSVKIYEDEN